MNDAVREHQGRPRGAPRRRRRLHGRRPGHDRARRLADDGVPHARRRAVLRRHLLPEARTFAAQLLRRRRRRVARPSAPTSLAQAGQLTEALDRFGQLEPAADLPGADAPQRAPCASSAGEFDPTWGGFGGAPKFPQTMSLELLLRATRRRRRATARSSVVDDHRSTPWRRAASTTTSAAASPATRVDDRWLVPHFEKMLYDQALLARVYLHAWQVTGEARYRQVLDETIGYVLRDLRHPAGGFFSAEDADSPTADGQTRARSTSGRRPRSRAVARRRAGADAAGGVVRRHRGRQLRGRQHPRTGRSRGDLRPARRGRGGPARACSRPASSARGPASTTRCSPSGTPCCSPRWPRPRPPPATRRGSPPRSADGEFLLAELRRADGRWLRSWQARRRRPPPGPTPPTTPRWSSAFTRLAEATGEARWIAEAARDRRRAARPVLGRRPGRPLHHRRRRRGPRRPAEGPPRQRHAVGQLAGRRRPAPPRRPHRRGRATRTTPTRSSSSSARSPRSRAAGLRPPARRHRPAARRHHRGRRRRRPARPGRRRAHGGSCPTPSWRGASRYDSPLWERRGETGFAYVCEGYVLPARRSDARVDRPLAWRAARAGERSPSGAAGHAAARPSARISRRCRRPAGLRCDDLVDAGRLARSTGRLPGSVGARGWPRAMAPIRSWPGRHAERRPVELAAGVRGTRRRTARRGPSSSAASSRSIVAKAVSICQYGTGQRGRVGQARWPPCRARRSGRGRPRGRPAAGRSTGASSSCCQRNDARRSAGSVTSQNRRGVGALEHDEVPALGVAGARAPGGPRRGRGRARSRRPGAVSKARTMRRDADERRRTPSRAGSRTPGSA